MTEEKEWYRCSFEYDGREGTPKDLEVSKVEGEDYVTRDGDGEELRRIPMKDLVFPTVQKISHSQTKKGTQ